MLSSFSFPLTLTLTLCLSHILPSSVVTAATQSTYFTGLDAYTPQSLLNVFNAITAPDRVIAPRDSTRPVYADLRAVNQLFPQLMGYQKDYQTCKDTIMNTVFTFPANCSYKNTEPDNYITSGLPREPSYSNQRLHRRSIDTIPAGKCISIPVRCINPWTIPTSVSALIREINRILALRPQMGPDGFSSSEVIYAPHQIVQAAGKQCSYLPWHPISYQDGGQVAVWTNSYGKNATVECL
ncbi:MAG: hypothetical protein DHS80DRAFT_25905 [Piptocephalis tieghemiana]|nr:MAG: hypothetical protein DHS80DRAFT_25905 [Piptocephalis tieghemiana]